LPPGNPELRFLGISPSELADTSILEAMVEKARVATQSVLTEALRKTD
jgi:hypothetical protein